MNSLLLTRLSKSFSFTYPCPRKLRQIMKMSLIEKEPLFQIEHIWKQYHQPRVANIASILSKEKYEHMVAKYKLNNHRANKAPLFLIPVFRKGGHFKLITQWQKDCFLGTYLEDYKRQKTNANPYIVFTMFTQLLYSKGVVLVRGDIINNSLVKPEAEKLWEFIQKSYLQPQSFEQVDNFNNQTQQFDEQKYRELFNIPA